MKPGFAHTQWLKKAKYRMQSNRSNPYMRRGSNRPTLFGKTDKNKLEPNRSTAQPMVVTSTPSPQPIRDSAGPQIRASGYRSPPYPISGMNHTQRYPQSDNNNAMSYSLIQLRPDDKLIDSRQTDTITSKSTHPSIPRKGVSLCRWVFVYVPVAMIACVFVYMMLEVVMKHLALRTLQNEMLNLPLNPPPPAPSSLPKPELPMQPPPAMLPTHWQTQSPDPFDLRSLALSGPANGYY